jgi:dimethylhistidine N-methyltransferase
MRASAATAAARVIATPVDTIQSPTPLSTFAAEVSAGLTEKPKRLPSKYLYDPLGSALFEAICRLPWYEVTRAEQRLLEAHASGIRAAADPVLMVELGPGSGEKIATLVAPRFSSAASVPASDAAPIAGPYSPRLHAPLRVHLIDISAAALEHASRTLAQASDARVTTSRATYEDGVRELPRLRPNFGRAMVLFLGSNIGNFDPPEAQALLHRIHGALRPGDTLLLGLDLVKPEPVLQLAYDDPLGVTAAFNRNLLTRMNAELGANFDLARFDHLALWRSEHSRIEMHLVSRGAQTIHIPAASCTIDFEDQETIWTESSYKYNLSDATHLGNTAGFRLRDQWTDEAGRFALTLFEVCD